jgi:hypothetical protein
MVLLTEIFTASWRNLQGVAPNSLLGVHFHRICDVLKFIEQEPSASKLKEEIHGAMEESNWLLDPQKLETFVQAVGEAQFWRIARSEGVNLERIPEQGKNRTQTPDFRIAGLGDKAPCFEVKTLSVVSSATNLKDMNEASYGAQLELSRQRKTGAPTAIAVHEVAPHGNVKHGLAVTTIIRNLLQKATNNIKPGQYAAAPTCLVLNLLLIDGYCTGNANLRPIVLGYPASWNVMSGVYWNLAFGKTGHLVFGIAEFEGKASVEGELGREGILVANPDIAALLLVIHGLSSDPILFGLKRESEEDIWSSERRDLATTFFKLVKNNWNDERDTNGSQLTLY